MPRHTAMKRKDICFTFLSPVRRHISALSCPRVDGFLLLLPFDGENLQNHFYCPVSLQRFIDNFPVGFAFHRNLHVETVVFIGFAAAGKSYGAGAVLNNFGNRGFHFTLIDPDNFINPRAGIFQLKFSFLIFGHSSFTVKIIPAVKLTGKPDRVKIADKQRYSQYCFTSIFAV